MLQNKVFTPPSGPAAALEYYQEGLGFNKAGQHELAIRSFKQAIQLDPNLPNIHMSLGIAYYQTRKYANAFKNFKRTLKTDPDNGAGNFFMGLVYQKGKKYRRSNSYFKIAMKNDADFEQLALFNMGLNNQKLNRIKSARRSFLLARKLDPDSEIGRSSQQLLQTLKTGKKEKKKWSLDTHLGLEVSDNVTQVEQDIVSRKSGTSLIFELEGSYRFLETDKYELEAGYDFFQRALQERTDLDFQSHAFSLGGSKNGEKLNLGGDYSYIFSTLDGSRFLGIHFFSPSVGIFQKPNLYTNISYIFQDKNFFTDDRRDATSHSFGLDQFIFFKDYKVYAALGYRVGFEQATGDAFDYVGNKFTVRYKTPLPFEALLNLSLQYHLKDYDNITPSIGTEREDKVFNFKMELSRNIWNYLDMVFNYEHIDSQSNLPATDYSENIFKFGLEAHL